MTDKSLAQQVEEEQVRLGGSECGGTCKHSAKVHRAVIRRNDGGFDLACCKVDCGCMKLVQPSKK